MFTEEEIERRVLEALYSMLDDDSSEEGGIEALSRKSGVEEGHIYPILDDLEISYTMDGLVMLTSRNVATIRAAVKMPIARSQAIAGQQFNVTAGAGSLLQVGHHVSGSQTVNYSQVFAQMIEKIENSSLPAPQKAAALTKLRDLLMTNGVATLFDVSAEFILQKLGLKG